MPLFVMARIRRLTRRQIGLAEIHARRLDKKSKSRAVRKELPVTWVPDGIDLAPLILRDNVDHYDSKTKEDEIAEAEAVAAGDPPKIAAKNALSLPYLYDRHVAGAFIPTGKSKAIHMLVLFPDDVKQRRGLTPRSPYVWPWSLLRSYSAATPCSQRAWIATRSRTPTPIS